MEEEDIDIEESKLPGLFRRGRGKSLLPGRKSFAPGTSVPKLTLPQPRPPPVLSVKEASQPGKSAFTIGDKVCISGVKTGRLLYFGKTLIAEGVWCGIELDEPVGKHDGEVEGVRYFTCLPGHGIFAPVDKVSLSARETAPPCPNLPQTAPTLTQETRLQGAPKPFQSKLQRRILPQPKTYSQPVKDPGSERGSLESLSSKSDAGSDLCSQKTSDAESDVQPAESQIKKPKLSFLRKPNSIPKPGKRKSPHESTCDSAADGTQVLEKSNSSGQAQVLQKPGVSANQTIVVDQPTGSANQTIVVDQATGSANQTIVVDQTTGSANQTIVVDQTTGSANQTVVFSKSEDLASSHDQRQVIDKAEKNTILNTTIGLSNQTQVVDAVEDVLNQTRVIGTYCGDVNQTHVLDQNHDLANQTRLFEKRGQPEDKPEIEPLSKRPRFSQLPTSRLPQTVIKDPPKLISLETDVGTKTTNLNSTFMSAPSQQRKLPAVPDNSEKTNGTFNVSDSEEAEYGDHEAFSPEVHRQLVAGGRQYLNLTFDAESEVQVVGLPENLDKIVTSPTYSANGEDNCEGGEEMSELDSSLEFLRGDRLIGEATRLGILRPEELENTNLLSDTCISADISKLCQLDQNPVSNAITPKTDADTFNRSSAIREIKELEDKNETKNSQKEVCSLTEKFSFGILRSIDYNIADGSNFLLDNPRILELRTHNANASSMDASGRLKSASSLFGEDNIVSTQQDHMRLASEGSQNFDISACAITSTPMALPAAKAKPALILKDDLASASLEKEMDTVDPFSEYKAAQSGIVEDVRRNLDFTNNCNDGRTESLEPGTLANEKIVRENITEHSPVLEEKMGVDNSSQMPPVQTMESVDSAPISKEMQASLVIVKPEPKPMTDSGISLMTASQEIASIQPGLHHKELPDTELIDGAIKSCDLDGLTSEQHQLAADLIAGHNKMDRPLSLISSISSVDTGYVPDTDSERGTLTTNSPSEWLERPGSSTVLVATDREKNLTDLYAQTFQDYQKGVMRGMVHGSDLESDSDLYSDTGTLAAHSEKDESDLEETKMDMACRAADQGVPDACTEGETSETESSNDVTEIMVGNFSSKHQDSSNGEGSMILSEDKSREHSREAGEYQGSRDTTPGMESDKSIAGSSTCRTEHELDQDLEDMEGDKSAEKSCSSEGMGNISKLSEEGKPEKPQSKKARVETTKTSGKKQKTPEIVKHKKPNVNVGSKLAEYLKTPAPVRPREEGKENVSKIKKNLTNKKRTDSGKDGSKEKTNSGRTAEEKGEAEENKATYKREKVAKEPPKIVKRTTPKSKWGDIMSQIESHKDSPPKPKEKPVKSNLESIFSQPPVPKQEVKKAELPSKLPAKKKLPSIPKPDYSRVKSRLNTGSPTSKAAASSKVPSVSSGSGVVLHLDLSESINDSIIDSLHGSTQSSRSDLSMGHNIDLAGASSTTKRRSLAKVSNKSSVLMRPERPGSAGSTRSDDVVKTSVKAMNDKNSQKSPRRKSEIKSSIPPIDQNRNKSIKSKTVNNLKETEQQNNLKTAQEISRLEALCEARTKELIYLKMQLKSGITAFDAMSALVNYLTQELDAFSCPVIKRKLEAVQKQLSDTQSQLAGLEEHKKNLEDEIVSLNKQHEASLAVLNTEHSDEISTARNLLEQQHETKVKKVGEQHKQELEDLRKYHERHIKEVGLDHNGEMNQLKLSHIEEIRSLQSKHDDQMEELHRQHKDKLEDITHRFESIKLSLSEKLEGLRGECEELRNRARLSEEALHRDTDVKVQMALAPFKDLPQEIESLKLVIDMRNDEIRDLRRQKIELEKQLEELPVAREKCIYLKQQVENLEAINNIKTDHEKQLNEKCQLLMRKYDRENKTNKRLSMNVEELMWKMQEETSSESGSSENLVIKRQLSHSPPGSEGERKHKSWSSFSSETSLSPAVIRRNGDSPDKKLKRRSATYLSEGRNNPSSPQTKRSPSSRSMSESVLSHCDSSFSELGDSSELAPPLQASSPQIKGENPDTNGAGMKESDV